MTTKRRTLGKDQEALLDALIAGCDSPEDIVGESGLLKELQKRLMERALNAELTHHLGYEANERHTSDNCRNGKTSKTVHTQNGSLEIEIPRDRNGEFEPQLVKKHQRRLEGFDEQVIALYARGLSTRDIQSHLEELYGTEVSPTLISNVTSAVARPRDTAQDDTSSREMIGALKFLLARAPSGRCLASVHSCLVPAVLDSGFNGFEFQEFPLFHASLRWVIGLTDRLRLESVIGFTEFANGWCGHAMHSAHAQGCCEASHTTQSDASDA
jgi:hypothetical protein